VDQQRWERIKHLLAEAAEQSSGRRSSFLADACGDDHSLQSEVEALLEHHEKAGSFLARSPAAKLVTNRQWTPVEPTLPQGEIVAGRFQIHSYVGRGGMGEVYQAKDARLRRPVALKFLPDDVAQHSQALSRFQREAQAASALNHPNICIVYDIDEHLGRTFIAMEFLDGQSLKKTVTSGPLDLQELLNISIGIADALDAAHTKGIIHRDIKPENIFVNSRGDAKILDFGLAKLEREQVAGSQVTDPVLTQPGIPMGTAAYMSPEQARGESVDARTDLFSFGLVMYEMATGRRAFSGLTAPVVFAALLMEKPQPPSEINRSIPRQLEQIIDKAIEKNPALRYQRAADIRTDLQQLRRRLLNDGQASRKPSSEAPKKRPKSWVIVPVSIAAILAAVVAIKVSRRPAPIESLSSATKIPVVMAEFMNSTGDQAFDGQLEDAVAVQFEQSPMYQIVSADQVTEALKKSGLPGDAKLTSELAKQVCRSVGAHEVISGFLAKRQNEYVISAYAMNCNNGEYLAKAELQSGVKANVLPTIWKATADLRRGMGESLQSVESNNISNEVTTSSMEAFRAYEKGSQLHDQGDSEGSIPFFEQAVELDPNFAGAYAALGSSYVPIGATDLRDDALRKAFALRNNTSENEKLWIESSYYGSVTGEVFKQIDSLKRWEKLRPDEFAPHNLLGMTYENLGDYPGAIRELREALRLNPGSTMPYVNLGWCLLETDQYDELRSVLAQASAKGFDETPSLHQQRFSLALVNGDAEALTQEHDWAQNTSDQISGLWILIRQQVQEGRKNEARRSSDTAVQFAVVSNMKDRAARSLLYEAWAEALWGYEKEARNSVRRALTLCKSPECSVSGAQTLAMTGDASTAERLLARLAKDRSNDTVLNSINFPMVRSALAYRAGRAQSALQLLDRLRPFDFGGIAGVSAAYLRGLANQQLGRQQAAIKEFQSVLDHRGEGATAPERILAYYQLGCSFAATHDNVKSKAAFSRFLDLWKNADPDIPVFRTALSKYRQLQ